jgi:hypothetical protein
VPGADIDAYGVCAHCRAHARTDVAAVARQREERKRDLEEALRDCRGRGEYDVLVCLSGGKDSVYLLHRLKHDYGLKVLAYTVDMNVPDVAWANIDRAVARIGVEHVVYTPDRAFYREFFRYLLRNQDERGAVRTVCYVCAPLFEGYALKVATDKKIPLVVAGYSPGQPEPERMEYEFSRKMIAETNWTPPELVESGLFSAADLARFWNPFVYPAGTAFPRYLAPFHAWDYSQEKTMKAVVRLGLISDMKHASPVHSNCPVNWLLMYSDLKNLGYNPYAPEFSGLIRQGKASRLYWRIMFPVINRMIEHQVLLGKQVKTSLEWLGLRPEELVIRRKDGSGRERVSLRMSAA